MKFNIPEKILTVLQQLESAGFEAFLVGGSVRDLLSGREPKDWDITTKAKPEEILKIFPDGKYENDFGTVILPVKYITTANQSSQGGSIKNGQISYESTNREKRLEVLSKNIKIDKKIKKEIIQIAKKYLKQIECPAHREEHARSVVKNTLKIAEQFEVVDKNIIKVLAWFHDVSRAIGLPEKHIENSQKIVKKELQKYFRQEELGKLVQAVDHSSKNPSIFLEQQILREADIIDALNVKRINSFPTDEEKKEHLNWIKKTFNHNNIYKTFQTATGKRLLEEAVKIFNEESFAIDAEVPDWDNIGNIEITTYRIESVYSDNRRPDEVQFAETLEKDLSRRDFTANAIALEINFQFSIFNFQSIFNDKILNDQTTSWEKYGWRIVDLYGGVQDIKNKVIRAVGDANERFNEDALRMMRAIRFAAQLSEGEDLQFLKDRKGEGKQNQKVEYQTLKNKKQFPRHKIQTNNNNQDTNYKQNAIGDGQQKNNAQSAIVHGSRNSTINHEPKTVNQYWWIGENTFEALKKNAHLLKNISPERISDEFQKIILTNRPAWGIELLVETGLMHYIIPELYDTIGVRQNRHHYYGPFNTVYKHMLAALKTCPSEKLEVRLAAFFHDIGKPKSKRGHGYNSTFYGHEYIGARITKIILERLKFPRKVIDKTVLLVKNHMFYYNTDEVGEKGVRKVVRKVGLENINDLIDVRIGDRLGSGVAKAVPYKLRHFKYMVEKVSQDPISVKDLKINGDILLAEYDFKPGPQMGAILEILLAEVLDDPKLNTLKYLADRAIELQKEDLQQLRQIAKDKIKEEKLQEEKQTKSKYWVK